MTTPPGWKQEITEEDRRWRREAMLKATSEIVGSFDRYHVPVQKHSFEDIADVERRNAQFQAVQSKGNATPIFR